jgi:diguanylate cyclase (GGDEF)-like protein
LPTNSESPQTTFAIAQSVARRIFQAVTEKPVHVGQNQLQISLALGVTEGRTEAPDLETLLADADRALYEAKQKGGNQVAAL